MHSFSRSPQLVAMMKIPTIWLNILTKKYFTCSPHTYTVYIIHIQYTVYIIHGQNQARDWGHRQAVSYICSKNEKDSGALCEWMAKKKRWHTFICCKKSQEPFMRGSLGGEDKISNYEESHRPQIWSHVWYLKTLEWMAHVVYNPVVILPQTEDQHFSGCLISLALKVMLPFW